MLDTNAVIAITKLNETLMARLYEHSFEDFGISSIVRHELYSGAYKGRHIEANLARIADLRFTTVAFTETDAKHAGQIRARLERAGTPIGPYDVLIAGQALARSLTLVTRNQREFQRVAGLKTENWQD